MIRQIIDETPLGNKPNTIRHQEGDHVIHEADAHRPDMTMQVIKYEGNECITQYIHPDNGDRELYRNPISRLYRLDQHPDYKVKPERRIKTDVELATEAIGFPPSNH